LVFQPKATFLPKIYNIFTNYEQFFNIFHNSTIIDFKSHSFTAIAQQQPDSRPLLIKYEKLHALERGKITTFAP